MRAKVAKSGTIHFQHSMFSTDDRDPDYPPKADPSPPETEDVADLREFFQVDYREAYEVMLDALRNEEDPWLASISIDPQRSVPVGICPPGGSDHLNRGARAGPRLTANTSKPTSVKRLLRNWSLPMTGRCDRKGQLMKRKPKRDTVRDGIYTILSAAIFFPFVIRLIIDFPEMVSIFQI